MGVSESETNELLRALPAGRMACLNRAQLPVSGNSGRHPGQGIRHSDERIRQLSTARRFVSNVV